MATIEYMNAMMTPAQDQLKKDAVRETKKINCFECGGLLFKGDRVIAAMEFAYNNPEGGDFYVWLQDNREIIATIK